MNHLNIYIENNKLNIEYIMETRSKTLEKTILEFMIQLREQRERSETDLSVNEDSNVPCGIDQELTPLQSPVIAKSDS